MQRTHTRSHVPHPLILLPLVLFAVWLGLGVGSSVADPVDWTGRWHTRWRGGGAVLELTQAGQKVTGTYPLYRGRIEAESQGRLLVGDWIEPTRRGNFLFTLAPDGQSFMGRFDSGEWWTGGRSGPDDLAQASAVDRSTPRQVLKSLLMAANATQDGLFESLGPALAALDFSAAAGGSCSWGTRLLTLRI
jgi:MscS family membrane protein